MVTDKRKKYDVEYVKDRLLDYRESEKEIDNQIERLERLESKMYGLGSPEISDMPRGSSISTDRISGIIAQKMELEDEIRRMINKQSDEKKWIESILKKMKKSDHRAVIRMRYIDGEKWTDITEMLFGAREDFEEKDSAYLRTVSNIHGRALVNMAKIIEKMQDVGIASN